MLRVVELVERIDQANHSRMHQVFERHMPRQGLVNAARQVAHLGQLFEQDAVPLFFILPGGVGRCRVLAHDAVLAFPFTAKLRATAPRPAEALRAERAQQLSVKGVPAAASGSSALEWRTTTPESPAPPAPQPGGAAHQPRAGQREAAIPRPRLTPVRRRRGPVPLRGRDRASPRASLHSPTAADAPATAPAPAARFRPAAPDSCSPEPDRAGPREWSTDRGSKPARATIAAKFSALRRGSEPSAPALPPAWDGSPPAGQAAVSFPAGSAIRRRAASPLRRGAWPAPTSDPPPRSLRPAPGSATPEESKLRRRQRQALSSPLRATGAVHLRC